MKCATQKAWATDDGDDLIRSSVAGQYQVIPAACDAEKLRELGEAIADALKQNDAPSPELN